MSASGRQIKNDPYGVEWGVALPTDARRTMPPAMGAWVLSFKFKLVRIHISENRVSGFVCLQYGPVYFI